MEIDFRETIDLIKQGKEEGFNKLYSSTYQKVYARAKQCTKVERSEDANDLTQIVYIEAFKNIDKLSAPEATLSWLYEICYRQACKMYRGEREKRETLLATEEETVFDMAESIDVSTMPELSADQKATAEIVREIIEELPELQKMTILSFYFDEMKIEQIADMMQCSTNTVKSRLKYGRDLIKLKVEEHEKKGGYKLHVFTIPTLIWALKLLTDKTTLTAYAAENIYAESCTALGLKASSLALAGAGAAGSSATISTSTATATAAKTAAATGGKIGTAKALAVAAAVTVGGAGTIGGVYMYQHSQPAIVEEVETDDAVGFIDGTGVTEDGLFEYDANGDTVTLTAYIGDATDIIIPLEVAGRDRLILGAKLFQNTNVRSVDITENVIELHSGAFEEVFRNAKDLEEVIISGSVNEIPADTFHECTKLSNVIIKDGVKRIGDNAFFYCVELEDVVIPDSVEKIGQNVFGSSHVYEITVAPDCEVAELNMTGFPQQTDLIIHRKGQEEYVDTPKTLQDDLSEYMYLVKLIDIGNGRLEASSDPQDRIYPKKISDNEYCFIPESTGKLFEYGEYVEFQGYNMPADIAYTSFMYGDTIDDFQMVEGVDGLNEGNNGTIAFHLDTKHEVIVKLK